MSARRGVLWVFPPMPNVLRLVAAYEVGDRFGEMELKMDGAACELRADGLPVEVARWLDRCAPGWTACRSLFGPRFRWELCLPRAPKPAGGAP